MRADAQLWDKSLIRAARHHRLMHDALPPVTDPALGEILAALGAVDPTGSWPDLAPTLIPMLPRRRPHPFGAPEPVRRIFSPGLEVSVGIDIGPALLFVNAQVAGRWGVTAEDVFERAVGNVRDAVARQTTLPLACTPIDGVPITGFQSGGGWASALLLAPDLLTRVFGEAPALILAPMRDLLVRLPAGVDQRWAQGVLDDFAELDPNALEVPVLTLAGGSLRMAWQGSGPRCARRRH